MAVTCSLSTGKTRILIFGAHPSSVLELFVYLRSVPTERYSPMMVPALAMEIQAQSFSTTLNQCQDGIRNIEKTTGMRQFNHPHERNTTSTQHWKELDLIAITRDLSGFLSRFAFLKMQAETGAYLVEQMIRTMDTLIERGGRSRVESDTCENHNMLVAPKLEHIQSWYLGIAARCRYLSERTSAQSQTVSSHTPRPTPLPLASMALYINQSQVHSLIASQQNLTSIEIALASRKIAEESRRENEAMREMARLSRQDNELMIHIAKDSQAITVMASQDSAAMQAIASVTVLFLPATFTAVSHRGSRRKRRGCLIPNSHTSGVDLLLHDIFRFLR